MHTFRFKLMFKNLFKPAIGWLPCRLIGRLHTSERRTESLDVPVPSVYNHRLRVMNCSPIAGERGTT